MIIASCITIIMDNPLEDPTSSLKVTVGIIDMTITVIFLIESLMKIISLGFINYIKQIGNLLGKILKLILDFIIVGLSLASFG
jgi:hypothetical protein